MHLRQTPMEERADRCWPIITLVLLTILIYHTFSSLQTRCHYKSKYEVNKIKESLKRVLSQLEALGKNHSRLVLRLEMFPGLINASTLQLFSLSGIHFEEQSPTEEYEDLRRKIYTGTKELWYYLNYQLRKALNESLKPEIRQTIVKEVVARRRALLSNHERLQALDGHEEWRRREAESVSDLIQRRLHYLQNPPDCRAAKKLLCKDDDNGFGCDLHHVIFCLTNAYALERTLVLVHQNMINILSKWTKTFQPLSETCTKFYVNSAERIDTEFYNDTAFYLRYSRDVGSSVPVEPYFIPNDLVLRITRFSSDPYSWWIGQFIKYVMKLQKTDFLNDTIAKMKFKSPIVGVHVRRTDKIVVEAKSYDIEEYMSHVDDFYAQLELTRNVDQRRVYLATDDPRVLQEAIAKYPQYTFYGDYYKAQAAAVETRFTSQGLSNFLVDLHLLSLCDYVVCTFSSNIGRMAYELMQTRRIDAVNRFVSLDHIYYFASWDIRHRIAVKPNKDIAFEVGDLIKYDSKNSNVFTSYGTVLRTNVSGIFPLYKTEEYIMGHPYPEYKMVPLFSDTRQNTL